MERPTALVTGATGFLGGALCRRLAGDGWDVSILARNPAAAEALRTEHGVRVFAGDLADLPAVRRAVPSGTEFIFHCAAKVGSWGTRKEYYAANVTGTENLLAAARAAGVRRFVHVSTPSLCFRWSARRGFREDDPLPRPATPYAWSKRIAEERVRETCAAAGMEGVLLRPRAVFGPGDPHILPRMIETLRAGRLPIIGSGHTLTDMTFIENAVDALLLAAGTPAERCSGRTYHVTNGEPVNLWEMLRGLAEATGVPPPQKLVPFPIAFGLGATLEFFARALRLGEPPLTRYTASLLGRDATLDISAVRRDLGYVPRVSVRGGLEQFVAWWRARPH